jgi:hypothetical protein
MSGSHGFYKAMNVIECPEFWALLLYLQENLTDDDIPGCTKIRSSILKMWQTEFLKLKSELEVRIHGLDETRAFD